MVNTSKVLTVSYGTFSCTLEGFDDSFDTMKAIAEYFRDLASEDRYFGAEPPTPDAEMLARIAEREVSRRVEASQDGSNFVLRTALPDASRADVQPDSLISEPVETIEDASDTPAEVIQETADPADDNVDQDNADEIAKDAEIERDRAEAEAREAAEAQARAEAEEAAKRAAFRAEKRARIAAQREADERAAQEAKEKVARDAEAERAAQEQAKAEAAAAAKAAADAQAKAAAEAKAEADRQAELERKAKADAEAAAADDTDSVAAKLARIRAVVGQPGEAAVAPDYSEDEHAEDIQQGRPGDTDLEDILDDLPAAKSDAEDTINGVMARLASGQNEAIVESRDDVDVQATEAASATALEAEALETTSPEAPARAPIRARVIKMKREEFEAAIASGDIEEEDEDADDIAAEVVADPESLLSKQDEDELARELAAVEAELAGVVEDTETVDDTAYEDYEDLEPQAAISPARVAPRAAEELSVAPDAEMDRLMDQASSELEEPDGKKRRNALGHLRAAVAAARADKGVKSDAEKPDETETYRNDLQDAVQPRRPVRRLSAEDAAPAARPPLKLVAEQRVDKQPEAPAPTTAAGAAPQPVRPRRIKAGEAAAPATPARMAPNDVAPEGGTFLEFAEEMGATELPDLLEAAAAYLAYVEGKDQFSRPQLMTKVRMVQEENFSREDGLRSFGQLLRQGKIEKISGGRFTVSDRISFKPDTRAAG